jgi:hypothetical protein
VSLVSSASDALQMRVESTKLAVEPGAGRTGKLAKVTYQFNTRAHILAESKPVSSLGIVLSNP